MTTRVFRANELESFVEEMKWWREAMQYLGITGGFFNPPHRGHMKLIEESVKHHLCDELVVAINSDECAVRKHGYSFMPIEDRIAILAEIKGVSFIVENPYDTMGEIIRLVQPTVYLKGGDVHEVVLAEKLACDACGCKIQYGVGGGKTQSSSDFLRSYRNYCLGIDGSGL
jgi:D-beta-D-heptose 7-phosphate kinase/D-beta-D-heptose 1-phosphate adenosyltransferase